MAEKKIEEDFCTKVKAQGGLAFKWTSPGTAGVMDRIAFLPIPLEHREIVNRYVKLVELKDKNKRPEPLQERIAGWLRDRGYQVHCSDSKERNAEVLR
jgi:hypothetical protein